MNYITFPPPPSLAASVRFFWVLEHELQDGTPYIYRSMADGCAEMVFHYKGMFEEMTPGSPLTQSASIIQGPTHQYRRYITNESFGIFGVYLYPFALPALCALPSTDFFNETPDLPLVTGPAGRQLEEEMMLAISHAQRLEIITRFLENHLKPFKPEEERIQHAVRTVIHTPGVRSVNSLAASFNMSMRQFERVFKVYAGMPPKMYSRIIRFQSALNNYGLKGQSLTDIAYNCGYYDQSHFINDFKAFSGYNPREYFAGRAEGIEYRQV